MHSTNPLKIQRIVLLANIVENKPNPITTVCYDLTHHKILIAFHYLIKFGWALRRSLHDVWGAVYHKDCVVSFGETKLSGFVG